jgi:NAD(P)-dependent dehydrogenase (short-subunit alcohol dehydrogenase family)
LKSSSGSLPDYSFEMHHTDLAAPGHQSTSDGLLPAFNGNTKPLKSRALDQVLRIGILSGCAPWATARSSNIASVSAQHGNPGQPAYGALKGGVTTLIQLKYPGAGTAVGLAGGWLQGIAN